VPRFGKNPKSQLLFAIAEDWPDKRVSGPGTRFSRDSPNLPRNTSIQAFNHGNTFSDGFNHSKGWVTYTV